MFLTQERLEVGGSRLKKKILGSCLVQQGNIYLFTLDLDRKMFKCVSSKVKVNL
jgi:hypothetical protein